MKIRYLLSFSTIAGCLLYLSASTHVLAAVSLEQAISLAVKNDPWLKGNIQRQNALVAQSGAADSLPDPVLSLGLLNLPTDGFALDQEAMTQMKVGVAQMFPRGDSRAIQRQQLQQMAAKHPFQRQDRMAQVRVTVAQLWLDAHQAQQKINLIEQDRALFEQLAQIVEASYSSAQGKTRQQDVVRAQLEISRIDDRLYQLRSQRDSSLAKLNEWLVEHVSYQSQAIQLAMSSTSSKNLWIKEFQTRLLATRDQQGLANRLAQHPAILAIEQGIQAGFTGVKLAEQKYQPQWGVNASYAYRDDDQLGSSRADFFSVGLSVDLPLFTGNKQDKQVQAARLQAEATKTDKRLLLRSMLSQLDSLYSKYQGLDVRVKLYKNTILQQMQQQAEASLTAYTNDDGDFAEVMRARIAELNARIEQVAIVSELHKTAFHIDYFFTSVSKDRAALEGELP
jgi:outer membrane protein TolC